MAGNPDQDRRVLENYTRELEIRMCYQIETVFYHYRDNILPRNRTFTKYNLEDFMIIMFSYNLAQYTDEYTRDLYARWKDHEMQRPTHGAIILNPDRTKCVLVKAQRSNSWGFPKGKLNYEEEPISCAIREVREETGLEIHTLVKGDRYLECSPNENNPSRMYIVTLEQESELRPNNQHEIEKVHWFSIDSLDEHLKTRIEGDGEKEFWLNSFSTGFFRELQNWLQGGPPPPPIPAVGVMV